MIVLTGSHGLIGRAVASDLRHKNLKFLVLDSSKIPFKDWTMSLIKNNIAPNVIIHLAAAVPKPPVIRDTKILASLTQGIDQEINKMSEYFKSHVIYTSGCSLYPINFKNEPVDEKTSTRTLSDIASPYLRAKSSGEQLFLKNERSTILRISTPVGCGISSSSALGLMLKDARERGIVKIWGGGSRYQNYIDTTDISAAIIKATKLRPRETINIASPKPISMMMLAECVIEIFPKTRIIYSENLDPKENQKANFSIVKAEKVLNWKPRITLRQSLNNLARCL